jgi:hypothetical protein
MTNREVIIMEQKHLTTLFVGIDVDSQFIVIYMMDFKQNKLDRLELKTI